MHIRITGIIESDEPLNHDRHQRIILELLHWAEERGLYLSLTTKLEEHEDHEVGSAPGD
jgi:hypothetical protein